MLQTPMRHRISDRSRGHAGRHRFVAERIVLPTRATVRRVLRSRVALVGSALACLGLAATAGDLAAAPSPIVGSSAFDTPAGSGMLAPPPGAAPPAEAGTLMAEGTTDGTTAGTEAGGSAGRVNPGSDLAAEAARQAEEERLAAEAAWLAANPPPVAGLDQAQMNNALRIVQTGQAMGLPKRAYVIAIATAMQESRLYNLASTRIPESYHYWHEGSGSDHDSVGLFQQRASTGWGRVQDLMDPFYASKAFYSALVRVSGWESMPLTRAAQRVQVSAFPSAYAKHETAAQAVVNALVPTP